MRSLVALICFIAFLPGVESFNIVIVWGLVEYVADLASVLLTCSYIVFRVCSSCL